MSYEWLHEGELSSEPLQICFSSSIFHCYIRGAPVTAKYNPTVGANIMSSIFARTDLKEEVLTLAVKTLKYGPRLEKQGLGVVLNVPIGYKNVEIPRTFHIF